jgi:hypothetical protein
MPPHHTASILITMHFMQCPSAPFVGASYIGQGSTVFGFLHKVQITLVMGSHLEKIFKHDKMIQVRSCWPNRTPKVLLSTTSPTLHTSMAECTALCRNPVENIPKSNNYYAFYMMISWLLINIKYHFLCSFQYQNFHFWIQFMYKPKITEVCTHPKLLKFHYIFWLRSRVHCSSLFTEH